MIISKHNVHFKRLLHLQKHSARERAQLFLVEGEREIKLATKEEILALYYSHETPFIRDAKNKGISSYCLSTTLFKKVAYREKEPVALCKQRHHALKDLHQPSILLICESIEKPGNLGAMLRTSVGANVSGVIITNPCIDIFHPNVIRNSLGAIFCVPIIQATSTEIMEFVKEKKIQLVLAHPTSIMPYYAINFTKPSAILIGNETKGISTSWLCNETLLSVNIPMQGPINSLNAAIAAAILLYESVRQNAIN